MRAPAGLPKIPDRSLMDWRNWLVWGGSYQKIGSKRNALEDGNNIK